MVVDKIGNTGNVIPVGGVKSDRVASNNKLVQVDSVSISKEAKEMASSINIVRKAPDVRREKVDSVKQKMVDGFYERDTEILERVAEKIAQALLR